MDITLLFSSSSGIKQKFTATLIILSLAIVIYTFIGLISQGGHLILLVKSLYSTLLICVLLIIPILGAKLIRWRLILSMIGLRIPISKDAKCWISSQAFLATPGGSGLAIRALLLKKKHNIPIPASLSAIIFERLSDLFSVIVLALIININFFLKQVYIIPASVLILTIFLYTNICHPNHKWLDRFANNLLSRLNPDRASSNESLIIYLKKLFRVDLIIITTLLGFLPWAIEGFSLYLILNSFGSVDIHWVTTTFAHISAVLLGALSLIPGGLGTAEATTVGILTFSGIPLDIAAPSTVLIRLLTIWLATIIGMVSLILPVKTPR